jgi:hypothetical protein
MNDYETVSLKEFFTTVIHNLATETTLRFDALDKALDLAREDAKSKYEHLNALRGEVITDRGLMVKGDTCKQTHLGVSKEFTDVKKEINLLREARSQVEGRAVEKIETRSQSNWSTGLTIVVIISSVSVIISILNMVIGK